MKLEWVSIALVILCVAYVNGQTITQVNITDTCIVLTNSTAGNITAINATDTCNCEGIPFPSYLFNLSNTHGLSIINLPNCNFSGAIFSAIYLYKYSSLVYVDLHGNSFKEQLSIYLGAEPKLQIFNIANNQFYGVVPDFSRLPDITTFIISNNSFWGQFQSVVVFAPLAEYSSAGNLIYLDGSRKSFETDPSSPAWLTPTGIGRDGLPQFDCVTILKGVRNLTGVGSIPSWCSAIDAAGASRCTCLNSTCGNGLVEDGEDCEPNNLISGAQPCCDNTTCRFVSSGATCSPENSCYTSLCNSSGQCVFQSTRNNTYLCRPSQGPCDAPEYCNGTFACPQDLFAPAATLCHSESDCGPEELCNGSSIYCPSSLYGENTVCRPAVSICDEAENCTGVSRDCPPDLFAQSSVVCREVNGTCDKVEYCNGTSSICPDDTFLPANITCRPSAGICDITELCSGNSPQCPNDTFNSSTTICRPATGACDVMEYCTGDTPLCPDNTFLDPSTVCANKTCYIDSICGNSTDGTCPILQPLQCSAGASCSNISGNCTCQNSLLTYPHCGGCGDGYCSLPIETCVNCPADCPRPCDMCGDQVCGINGGVQETCNNCPQDCNNCTQNDPCVPACEHGVCVRGACKCDALYSGPSCINSTIPKTNVTNNSTSPIVYIHVEGLNTQGFSISLEKIYEADTLANETVSDPINLDAIDFILNTTVTPDYTFWNYSTTVYDSTILQVYIFYFVNPTIFDFFGDQELVGASTIKLSLFVSNWPFRSTRNSLFVIFESENPDPNAPNSNKCVEKGGNPEDDLRWYKLTVDDISLYAQLEDTAILDGYVRPISFSSLSDTTVAAEIPFFWTNLTLDPNFSVLLEDSNPCAETLDETLRHSGWHIYYIIPIIVVVVAGVLALLLWKYENLRLWNKLRSRPRLVVELDETNRSMTSQSVDLD